MKPGVKTVTDKKLLNLIQEQDGPAVFTKEMAEATDLSEQTIRNRLQKLRDNGQIESKQPGKPILWWLPECNHESCFADDS